MGQSFVYQSQTSEHVQLKLWVRVKNKLKKYDCIGCNIKFSSRQIKTAQFHKEQKSCHSAGFTKYLSFVINLIAEKIGIIKSKDI